MALYLQQNLYEKSGCNKRELRRSYSLVQGVRVRLYEALRHGCAEESDGTEYAPGQVDGTECTPGRVNG